MEILSFIISIILLILISFKTEIFKHLYPIFEYISLKLSIYLISFLEYISVLLNKIMVSIPKDLVAIKILSINIDDVIGLLGVTNKKQQSILEAII